MEQREGAVEIKLGQEGIKRKSMRSPFRLARGLRMLSKHLWKRAELVSINKSKAEATGKQLMNDAQGNAKSRRDAQNMLRIGSGAELGQENGQRTAISEAASRAKTEERE